MHEILGCEKNVVNKGFMYWLYDIEKRAALTKFKAAYDLNGQVTVFDTPSVSTVDVVVAGKNTLARLYNGKPVEAHWVKPFLEKRWLLALLMYSHIAYHLPQQQKNHQCLCILPGAAVEGNRI